jgi:DNA repair photolyase
LEILLNHGYAVTTLTKNTLASRDLDLLATKDAVEFGVTVTTLDESIRRIFEPNSSPAMGRLEILREAKRKGISTYVFLGPLLPYLSDTESSLLELLKAIKDVGADYFYVDRLNPRFGVWPSLKLLLQGHFPELIADYGRILFNEPVRSEYSSRLIAKVSSLARRLGLDDKMTVCC